MSDGKVKYEFTFTPFDRRDTICITIGRVIVVEGVPFRSVNGVLQVDTSGVKLERVTPEKIKAIHRATHKTA